MKTTHTALGVAGIAGLALLGLSLINMITGSDYAHNLAFVTQGTRTTVYKTVENSYEYNKNADIYDSDNVCGNGLVDDFEMCDSSSKEGNTCSEGYKCMSCFCEEEEVKPLDPNACIPNKEGSYPLNGDDPSAFGNSSTPVCPEPYYLFPDLTCVTNYSLSPWVPPSVFVYVYVYQTIDGVKYRRYGMREGYSFGTPAILSKVGTNTKYEVNLDPKQGVGLAPSVREGGYHATSFIIDPKGNKIECSPAKILIGDIDKQTDYIDLELQMNQSQTSYPLGQPIEFTYVISNKGTIDATNFYVKAYNQAGSQFVSASNGGTYYNGVVSWPIAILKSHENISLTISVLPKEAGSFVAKSELCNYPGSASHDKGHDPDSTSCNMNIYGGPKEDDEGLLQFYIENDSR